MDFEKTKEILSEIFHEDITKVIMDTYNYKHVYNRVMKEIKEPMKTSYLNTMWRLKEYKIRGDKGDKGEYDTYWNLVLKKIEYEITGE